MSCGGHHETPCDEVLQRVYFFIDNELDGATKQQIEQHLAECGPCLDEVAVERLVKALLGCSCTETAPTELRQRVVFAIRQVQLEITQTRVDLD
jgi:mycothiol system anti-sigma-R factor